MGVGKCVRSLSLASAAAGRSSVLHHLSTPKAAHSVLALDEEMLPLELGLPDPNALRFLDLPKPIRVCFHQHIFDQIETACPVFGFQMKYLFPSWSLSLPVPEACFSTHARVVGLDTALHPKDIHNLLSTCTQIRAEAIDVFHATVMVRYSEYSGNVGQGPLVNTALYSPALMCCIRLYWRAFDEGELKHMILRTFPSCQVLELYFDRHTFTRLDHENAVVRMQAKALEQELKGAADAIARANGPQVMVNEQYERVHLPWQHWTGDEQIACSVAIRNVMRRVLEAMGLAQKLIAIILRLRADLPDVDAVRDRTLNVFLMTSMILHWSQWEYCNPSIRRGPSVSHLELASLGWR